MKRLPNESAPDWMPPHRYDELWARAISDAEQEIGPGTARLIRLVRAAAWICVVLGSIGSVAAYSLNYGRHLTLAYLGLAVLGLFVLSIRSNRANVVQLRACELLKALTQAYRQSELESPDFYHSEAWKWTRLRLLKKTRPKCAHCGRRGSAILTIDHIIPRDVRPDLALETSNLEVICYTCKSRKELWGGDKDAALG